MHGKVFLATRLGNSSRAVIWTRFAGDNRPIPSSALLDRGIRPHDDLRASTRKKEVQSWNQRLKGPYPN